MNVPQASIASAVVPTSTADIVLHNFIGLSWHILMPYTIFGAGLMIYSQYRLTRGQYALKKASTFTKKSPKNKRLVIKIKLNHYGTPFELRVF